MEEKKLIYESLMEINKSIGVIGKTRKNEQQNFKFRGIDDVMNELHELFAVHHVFILPVVKSITREERPTKTGGVLFYTHLTVDFSFIASDGSQVTATVIGEAMDSGDKGTNKAMSAALKYALLQMFLIPTEEPKDPDAVTPAEVKPTIQKPEKPSLSNDNLMKAIERIKAGEVGIIAKIKDTYRLSQQQIKELNDSVPAAIVTPQKA